MQNIFKFIGVIIVFLIVFMVFTEEDKLDKSTNIIDSEENTIISNWNYSNDEDKMSGEQQYFSSTTSINKIDFEFPYDGGSTFRLIIRNMGRGNEVLMIVSNGQFLTSITSSEKARIKLDGGSVLNYNFRSSNDGSVDVIFFNSSNKLISALKTSKKIMIEVPFYQAGRQIIYFDVEGLIWDK